MILALLEHLQWGDVSWEYSLFREEEIVHTCCSALNHLLLENIEHLLKVYPQAMANWDGSGQLPLHCTIEVNTPLSIIKTLLRASPATGEAVFHGHDQAMLNFPPALLLAAATCDCDLESIFVLLGYVPTIMNRH